MIKELEKSIFIAALKDAESKDVIKHFDNSLFTLIYKSSMRRLVSNLDPNSYVHNAQLLNKIKNNDLSIKNLAEMNIMDYAPHIYSDLRERQVLREQTQLEGNKSMATDMFKCGRCQKRETTFYELQTRSADEPMTKFINCLNCGNHWRQ
jgi:transcription elongation factor S-II